MSILQHAGITALRFVMYGLSEQRIMLATCFSNTCAHKWNDGRVAGIVQLALHNYYYGHVTLVVCVPPSELCMSGTMSMSLLGAFALNPCTIPVSE